MTIVPERCHDLNTKSLHSSCIINKKRVISEGYNTNGSIKLFGCYLPSIHAEMHALYRLYTSKVYKNIKNNANLTLTVVRYDRQGNLKNSKPCQACVKLMKKFGIKTVTYSDDNGDLITCKLDDIGECCRSSAMRSFDINPMW